MDGKDRSWRLLEAAAHGDVKGLSESIHQDTDVNLRDNNGITALMCAVEGTHTDAVKLLIANGAEVNVSNKYGNTPLHFAVAVNSVELVRMLLEAGADPTAKNSVQSSPRQWINRNAPSELQHELEALLENTVNVSQRHRERIRDREQTKPEIGTDKSI